MLECILLHLANISRPCTHRWRECLPWLTSNLGALSLVPPVTRKRHKLSPAAFSSSSARRRSSPPKLTQRLVPSPDSWSCDVPRGWWTGGPAAEASETPWALQCYKPPATPGDRIVKVSNSIRSALPCSTISDSLLNTFWYSGIRNNKSQWSTILMLTHIINHQVGVCGSPGTRQPGLVLRFGCHDNQLCCGMHHFQLLKWDVHRGLAPLVSWLIGTEAYLWK